MSYSGSKYNLGGNYDFASDLGMGGGAAAASTSGAGSAGFLAGGPLGAAIGVGGSFLSQYLAQRAAQDEKRKELAMRAQENYDQDQTQAMNNLMGAYRAALL